ncbi:MAG: copper-containing nitrite reductase [Brevundimonas sp.]|uniref:copper-containing nitrite reductase n=1 Tax=Brevundimonas sp. TaxID=1871086 RepID=UPI00260F16CB|nr:copper-containing nitrite reductase [Brevundimonas sp.]MDI6624393.1 copper-containing nitrite reductase [Brevundimonas sp.]MDQ7811997.1 copper-containing nitrite reductase [Brevundimonas sp.]
MKLFALLTSAAVLALAATAPGVVSAQEADAAAPAAAINIIRSASDLPGPLNVNSPRHHVVGLETTEVIGQLEDGTSYTYWTYNNKVPGPFVRVRVGDTVEVNMTNAADSVMMHNVDFHAVTGPGGGAAATNANPGETKSFTFKALQPGLYVYHCATPMVAQHISNGMYGLILVEPEGGLPEVDHEFYVMQGEIYTEEEQGTPGLLTESVEKLLNEQPTYYVMNGAFKALTGDNALKAEVGDTARIYFGVGGPNKISSFHVIGEIFDTVYRDASLTSPPITDVQTVLVPPGGATVVDLKFEVPGSYIMVDHALSRVDRGAAGIIEVTGPQNPEIFRGSPEAHNHMEH